MPHIPNINPYTDIKDYPSFVFSIHRERMFGPHWFTIALYWSPDRTVEKGMKVYRRCFGITWCFKIQKAR